MCEKHAPFTTILFLANLIHAVDDTKNESTLLNNLASYMLFMVLALLCNGKWLYTSIAILLTTSTYLLFYAFYLEIYDAQFIFEITFISLWMCFSIYYLE